MAAKGLDLDGVERRVVGHVGQVDGRLDVRPSRLAPSLESNAVTLSRAWRGWAAVPTPTRVGTPSGAGTTPNCPELISHSPARTIGA